MENYGTFDHLGNEFKTNFSMCEHYKMDIDAFDKRINKLGWNLEDALTKPIRKHHKGFYVDHLGNEFKTRTEICNYHGVALRTFDLYIKKGLSAADALILLIK
jgi:hypothetical protein